MRLRSIAWAPFGALRDVALELDGPRGALHVIYGPNEAGKSTALRGLIGFFFGIPHRTADQHQAGLELRVRARIELDDGRVLDRVRRKGHKDRSLRDGVTDEPVADDEIRRWIGGLDEATFRQLHALDHVRLREGAEAVLRGRGRLGELLLEASTGATGLSERLERLRAEAAGIYKPRGRNDALHLAEDAWLAASKQSAEAMLSHGSWQEQERGIAEVKKRVAEADRELRDLRDRHADLVRTHGVEEPVRKLRRKRAVRAEMGVVPDVQEGITALRDQHAREATEAAAEADRAAIDLAGQRAAAASAARRAANPAAGLDPAEARRLRARLEQAHAGRAEAALDLEAVERALAAAESRLGPAPAGASWDGVAVDARTLARVQARAAARREAAAARAAAARSCDESIARRQRLGDAAPEDATAADALGAEEALAAAIAVGRRAAVAARARDELAAREVELTGRIAAHAVAAGAPSADALAAAEAPDDAALAAEERDRLHARTAIAAMAREQEAARDRAARAAATLEALRGGAGVPAEAELDRLRRDRDDVVEESARAVDEGDARRAAALLRSLGAFVHRADAIADRLRHDAARVERAAQLEAEHRQEAARAAELERRLAADRATLAAREAAWNERWPALAGRDAEAARAWGARREAVVALRAELSAARARRLELDVEVAAATEHLAVALGEAGSAARTAGLDGAIVLADRRAEELRRRARGADERRAAVARADEERAAAEAALARAIEAEAEAVRLLAEVVRPLGLATDASHEEIATVAAILEEATRDRSRRDAARGKLARLDAEIAAAEAEWDRAARAAEVGGLGPEEAIARAEAARDARRELERLEEAMAQRAAVLERERERQRRAEQRLAEIEERTGLPAAALADAEAAARAARELDREIEQLEAGIVERLELRSMAEVEERLRDVDFELVAERVEQVGQELADLEQRRDRDLRTIGGQEMGLRLLGSESRASELAEQAEAHLVRARTLARRAAVAQAAVALLERAIEQHRTEREGPVLRRAASIFRDLTEGRWTGLQVAEAEGGELEIRCVRGDREHAVSELSQGTADQLYLALRLAAIEHHARGGPSLPLLLDDVLVHFDAERKVAALTALAAIAPTVQVILFTHERDVADAARTHLHDRAVVHELARRG